MREPVEFTGAPVVDVTTNAHFEVVLPTSASDGEWQTAFQNALPNGPPTTRIHVQYDAIRVVVHDPDQLDDDLQAVDAAAREANRRVDGDGGR
jgi:hypothetical protein